MIDANVIAAAIQQHEERFHFKPSAESDGYTLPCPIEQVLLDMRRQIDAEGSQAQFCRKHQISPQYVCDILLGRRLPGPTVLQAIGWRKSIAYKKRV